MLHSIDAPAILRFMNAPHSDALLTRLVGLEHDRDCPVPSGREMTG
jgi:hypothetical protein